MLAVSVGFRGALLAVALLVLGAAQANSFAEGDAFSGMEAEQDESEFVELCEYFPMAVLNVWDYSVGAVGIYRICFNYKITIPGGVGWKLNVGGHFTYLNNYLCLSVGWPTRVPHPDPTRICPAVIRLETPIKGTFVNGLVVYKDSLSGLLSRFTPLFPLSIDSFTCGDQEDCIGFVDPVTGNIEYILARDLGVVLARFGDSLLSMLPFLNDCSASSLLEPFKLESTPLIHTKARTNTDSLLSPYAILFEHNMVGNDTCTPFRLVPNVIGMTMGDAQTVIVGTGLVDFATGEYSDTVPAGEVFLQNPAAGTRVNPGDTVAIVVSRGPHPVTVPDVVGRPRAAAAESLVLAGLAVGALTEQLHETVPAGMVLSQSPVAGTVVMPGTAVALVLSKGPQEVIVPYLLGQALAAAHAALTNAGLTLGSVAQQYHAHIAAGQVSEQNPSAGVRLPSGGAVSLVVSRGPRPLTVPAVVGYAQSAAQTILTDAGLTVGAVGRQYHPSVPAGQVISQNPAAGAELPPGGAVAIDVSRGPQPVMVPNVVGRLQTEAKTVLTDAGLAVGAVTRQYHATILEGVVISQNPVADVPLAHGGAVALVVSRGPQRVTVPDVAGQTQIGAQAAIRSAGLTVGVLLQHYNASVPVGRVISQNPSAGAEMVLGGAVSLTLSRGPRAESVTVPDTVGMPLADAASVIRGAGLGVGAVTRPHHPTVPEGCIVSQNPAAQSLVAPDTAVTLAVSAGPDPLGGDGNGVGGGELTAAQARALLAAGFDVADINGDNRLSFAEARAVLPALTQQLFNQLDANGDGFLSRAELGADGKTGCGGCRGCGGYAGKRVLFDLEDWKTRLGDIFLTGLMLCMLAVRASRRK